MERDFIKEPLISVIIPVYNVASYLERCIASVCGQTYKKMEIILVDDGSTDSSGQICDEAQKRDPRISVIHKENGGLSDARNAALEVMRGEYVMFVDSDDYIAEDCVMFLYGLLLQYASDVAIGTFRYVYKNDTSERADCRVGEILVWNKEETLQHLMLKKKFSCNVWGILYKSELYRSIRFPKGKLCEDLGTSYKIYDQIERAVYADKIIYFYFVREGSIQNSRYSRHKMDEYEFAVEILKFMDEKYPKLHDAAVSGVVSSCFHILFGMDQGEDAVGDAALLKATIKKYRRTLLIKRRVARKVRCACLCSYFGFGITRFLYSRLGIRGRLM